MKTRAGRNPGLACAAALLAALLLGPSGATAEMEMVRGEALFAQYCSSCHGLGGVGGTPLAGILRTPPPDLTRIAERRGGWFPDLVIQETIDGRFVAHGGRQMPVWGNTLSSGDVRAITQHLYSIQRDKPTGP